tara:strand:- start:797 stop:1186 length:390 start_codon:yes stop_codon:yes gene_type:complete
LTTLSSVRKGFLGEQRVITDLIKKDLSVYIPVVDDVGVDMVVDTSVNIYKVQVKTLYTLKSKTSIEVKLDKHIDGNHNIDIVAVYYQPKDIIAYVPFPDKCRISLALHTAKNNQKYKRLWFYEFMEFPP